MHTFDEIIGILRANFYVCIIYLHICKFVSFTRPFGDSSCRSVPIRRRNFRIIPLYDVRETNNISLQGFANYSIYYKTTTRSRCVLCILRVVLILASTTTLILVVVLAIFRNRSTTLLPDNRRTSVRPWRRLRNDPVESRGLLPPTDIEKITEKKKGSPGPVQLFFRGKPRRRGKWLVVTGICIAALRRKPKIGLIESNRIESNRIESMPLVSRPALWCLLFYRFFASFALFALFLFSSGQNNPVCSFCPTSQNPPSSRSPRTRKSTPRPSPRSLTGTSCGTATTGPRCGRISPGGCTAIP